MNSTCFAEISKACGHSGPRVERPLVVIQGLGFVGAAMATAVASACDDEDNPVFNVCGLDLANPLGLERVANFNRGSFPFECQDPHLPVAFNEAVISGNMLATADPEILREAAVAIVDINLDLNREGAEPSVDFTNFRSAIATLGAYLPAGALILVETTVPPGTCEKVVAPELQAALVRRGLAEDAILLAHSYERVMPGREYLSSIINFPRVYPSASEQGADAADAFLSKVINVKDYPLTRLGSTTASESAKVLENSYRATNIAFMEEWGRFAEAAGFDLFEVIDAIRMRPTHNNIRQPGFGVGGYCLTKDPLFALVAARTVLDLPQLDFPFCRMAVETNERMPMVTLDKIKALFDGNLKGRRILLLGVSYRQDVGDTRYSPSQVFWEEAAALGAELEAYDPYVPYWEELDRKLPAELPAPDGFDALVFCVPHHQFVEIQVETWLKNSCPLVVDANHVLGPEQRAAFAARGCNLISIGRGVSP